MKPVNMSSRVAVTTTNKTATADGLVFGYMNAGSGAVSLDINNLAVDGTNTNTGCAAICFPIAKNQQFKYSGSPTAVNLSYAPYL